MVSAQRGADREVPWTVRISVPRDDSPQQLYERGRHLAAQREQYDWDRRPGLPPLCKGVPTPERFSRASAYEMLSDAAESARQRCAEPVRLAATIADEALPLRLAVCAAPPRPRVIERWRSDREFARRRVNGINPFLITCVTELPEHFP